MSNLKATTVVDGNSIFTEFKGALTEQYVLQQLVLRYEPYYYAKTNSTQEIDFLLQGEEDEIVPLQGGRIKMRSPPKVLTGNFRPSQLSFFLS